MRTYTRDELIEAFGIYNGIAITEPDKFIPIDVTVEAAEKQADYLISIIEGTCIDLVK